MPADPESLIDPLASQLLAESGAPGLAVALAAGDKTFAGGYGTADLTAGTPASVETLFRLASATKSFTATALALLCDEGKLAWDDPVRRFVPDFVHPLPPGGDDLTLRDLLCHRSGFGWHDPLWYDSPWSRRILLERIRLAGPVTTPRTRFQYSNVMYILAGEILAEASGRSYEEFVTSRILEPLGMSASSFCSGRNTRPAPMARPHGLSPHGQIQPVQPATVFKANPACGLASSAEDMARWLQFQLRRGPARRLLSDQQRREMALPHTPVQPEEAPRLYSFFGERARLDSGLGWMLSDHGGRRVCSHTGVLPGYRAHVAVLPEADLAVAVLANLNMTWAPEALVYSLLDRYLKLPPKDWSGHFRLLAPSWDQNPTPAPQRSSQPALQPARDFQTYAGTFVHPAYGDLKVRREGEGLTLSWANFRGRLEPDTAQRFYLRDLGCPLMPGPEPVEYEIDARGRVRGLTFVGQRFERRRSGAGAYRARSPAGSASVR